jgi:hypothetical protein
MRVDYTLPAMQVGTPPELPDAPADLETGLSFREQLRTPGAPISIGWEQHLRLDARPFTGTYIGPPPRPHTLQLFDAETERTRWQSMLWRHSQRPDPVTAPSLSSAREPVHIMLEMLLQMQELEDLIVAQQTAVTRG